MKYLYLIIFLAIPYLSTSQIINFPDENLKFELLNNQDPPIDTNNNGEIEITEAHNYGINENEDIEIVNNQISNLSGLEQFINIERLRLYSGTYNSVNLSSFENLKYLNIGVTAIENIDLSNNPYLRSINVTSLNHITSLNLLNQPLLENLELNIGNLAEIDLSNNPQLKNLKVYFSNISSLDLSNQPLLEKLEIKYNNLSEIDLSNQPLLQNLELNNGNLAEIDLSNQLLLTDLNLSYNNITEIDLITNLNLINLELSGNEFESLNIEHLINLETFSANNNNLSTVDLNSLSSLLSLNCNHNSLESLDVSNLENLESIECSYNNIQTLLLPPNSKLSVLECISNQLTELTLNTQTEDSLFLDCGYNSLESLIINATLLTNGLGNIRCNDNELVNLDLSNAPLYGLNCAHNPNLETINLRNGANWRLEQNNLNSTSFFNTPSLEVICLDNSSTSILKDRISLYVGQNVNLYNNETCDDFVLKTIGFNDINEFIIYPIPVKEALTVVSKINIKNIKLYSLSGKILLSENDTKVVTTTQLTPGVYFTHITDVLHNREVVQIIKE